MDYKEYCCHKFSFFASGDREMNKNIRIIKLTDDFISKGYLGDNVYRYVITSGYTQMQLDTPIMVIEYCPFCGIELKKSLQ